MNEIKLFSWHCSAAVLDNVLKSLELPVVNIDGWRAVVRTSLSRIEVLTLIAGLGYSVMLLKKHPDTVFFTQHVNFNQR